MPDVDRPASRASVPGMVATWISPKARKGLRSDIAGKGLHAVEAIAAGEVVAAKGGQLMTGAQLAALPDPLPNSDIQIAMTCTSPRRGPRITTR